MPEPDTHPQGERQDQIIPGHTADGIQEYDNPMPAWWLWLFWGSAVFSLVYVLGIHVFGFVNTYEDDLNDSLDDLQMIRQAYAEANPSLTVDEATLTTYVNDPAKVAAGNTHFAAQCASCHGPEGQGLIGPNLADAYWLHGGTNVDIFNIISQGVLAQGMPPWEAVFSAEERAEMVAFIRSIQGSNPPNAKEPQGELVE